jgi:integrase
MAIYKRKNKWYIDVYVGNKRVRRSVGSRRQALKADGEINYKIRAGKLSLEDIYDPIPFDRVAGDYLEYCRKVKGARTYEFHNGAYIKHIRDFFSGYLISEINEDLLKDFQTRQKNKKLSNRTVNIHIGVIRQIIKHSGDNVRLKYPMLPETQKEHAFLTPDECREFIKHVEKDLTLKRIMFGICTGMRPGELAFLSWNDIDLELRIARIRSKPGIWTIKDRDERSVPLNDYAVRILEDLRESSNGKRWIFSNDKDRPVKSIKRALITAGRRAKLPKVITPNMLRHTFATHAIANGADIQSVKEILGHSDIKTTQRYLHPIKEQLKKTVDLIDFRE